MNKLYSVHDHWTDINKKNDVDIESIDGVITGIKVNGEDYGGSEWQNIFDNTITTVLNSDGFYTTNIGVVIEADSIKVTFDGVEYLCPKRSISEISTNYYGAPTPLEIGEEDYDWAVFPFSIATGTDGESMIVATQTAGTHTLKIDTPQSGGGESDFSTAQVTFANSSELEFKFIIPYAFDGEEETSSYGQINSDLIGSGTTINAILYKGYCFVSFSPIGLSTPNIEVSGDIEDMGHNDYIITGDCTITIS